MDKVSITIEIDPDHLAGYTNTHLAMLWHVAQANPDDGFEDSTPGELAEKIGREIIRRWLRATEPELWRHKGGHYYWKQLTKFAKYTPGDGPPGSRAWEQGTWTLRDEDDRAKQGGRRDPDRT